MNPTRALAAAFVCLAAIVSFTSSWSQVSAPSPGVGRIEGRVTNAEGDPVELALVNVLGQARAVGTDSAGRFVLTGVPTGLMTVRVLTMSYPKLVREITVRSGETAHVAFSLGTGDAIRLPEIEVSGTATRSTRIAAIRGT